MPLIWDILAYSSASSPVASCGSIVFIRLTGYSFLFIDQIVKSYFFAIIVTNIG